jgi:hypothetical protein
MKASSEVVLVEVEMLRRIYSIFLAASKGLLDLAHSPKSDFAPLGRLIALHFIETYGPHGGIDKMALDVHTLALASQALSTEERSFLQPLIDLLEGETQR